MNDIAALLALLFIIVCVLALSSGSLTAWAREEWRRMRADTWAPGTLTGPTSKEKDAAALLRRQHALAKRMRKKGRHLYSTSKAYKPALTTPSPAPRPPKADRVVTPFKVVSKK